MRGTGAVIALVLAAGGCFSPEAREGLACSQAGECPPGQSCQAGICTAGAAVGDASVGDGGAADGAVEVEPPGPFGLAELVALTCPGPVVCADVRDPFLAGTTTLYFTYAVNAVGGNYDVYAAARAEGNGPFGQAASVGGINSTLSEHSPFLSPDGLTLWFSRQDLSSGAAVRPYDEVLTSVRAASTFDVADPVAGAVNTLLGDERAPQVSGDGTAMLFTRAAEKTPDDHDIYLARLEGGQWNTIERLAVLSGAGTNERALSLVEGRRAIFYIRDDQIHEVIWTGDDLGAPAVDVVHSELDAAPLDVKVGVWGSPDGTEIWFDSNRSGAQQIYRAVRAAPTQ
jgi:hypothetical protein